MKRLSFLLASLFLLTFPTTVGAIDALNEGFNQTGAGLGFEVDPETGAGKPGFVQAFSTYVNGLVIMLGALFMILIIYGGWLWMTAQGREDQVKRGRDMIIHATIGIMIVLAARIIVEFALVYLGQASTGL